jgi:hypothetical protein
MAEERMKNDDRRAKDRDESVSPLTLRLALGGAVAFGALASGFLASRRGRRLVADTFKGTQRTPRADRILDRFFDEPQLGRRRLEVKEPSDGVVVVFGSVASERERELAVAIAESVQGVKQVHDRLVVDPTLVRRRARSDKDLARGR